jgi:Ferritin-like domain
MERPLQRLGAGAKSLSGTLAGGDSGPAANPAQQEQVHLETLGAVLDHYGAPSIPPCVYSFPVTSPDTFWQTAGIISAAGVSAVIGVAERVAGTDPGLARVLSSIATVEGRHDAAFRQVQGATPNPTPFDTGSTELWAYSLALSLTVPGSCPVKLPIPTISPLDIERKQSILPDNSTATTLNLTWDPTDDAFKLESGKPLLVGWINQLDMPQYTDLSISTDGKGTTELPLGTTGVSLAVLTTEQFETVGDLARGTMAGPAVVIWT